MNYRFLEDEATADVAFEAWGRGLTEVFKGSADAVVNVMVENPGDIRPNEVRRFDLENDQLDLLLYNFLEQIVYYKDAERFLCNVSRSTSRRSMAYGVSLQWPKEKSSIQNVTACGST